MTDKHTPRNSFLLAKQWFNFTEKNPDKVNPAHGILFFWLIEKNNRLNWMPIYGLPTMEAMRMTGIKSYNTYRRILNDLATWGFVQIVRKAKNQYFCKEVALSKFDIANSLNDESALSKFDIAKQSALSKNDSASESALSKFDTIKNNKEKPLKENPPIAFSIAYLPKNIFDSLAFNLWKQIYDDLTGKGIKPTNLNKAKSETWSNEIRLIIETDGRTEADITEVLNFLKTDEFWKTNIQSPEKLRKQFERLQTETRKPKKKSKQLSFQQDLSNQDYKKIV